MDVNELNIFVDESGDNALDSSKDCVSHLFYLVAVIVNNEQMLKAQTQLDKISKELCGGSEIRSSKICGDNERRYRFLSAIKDIDFGYYALIINKDKIPKDSGYQWKKTFYKATSKRIYNKVDNSSISKLSIYRDEIGNSEYMDSFTSYLKENVRPKNLFSEYSHMFVNSKDSRLIQLADLIAGTLSYCFDFNKKSDYSSCFRNILKEKEISTEVWPITLDTSINIPEISNKQEEVIYCNLLEKAKKYLFEIQEGKLDQDKMQELVLNQLLFARRYDENKNQAIVAERLMKLLEAEGYGSISKQVFTSSIIGKFRDVGIIITGTNLGYRLALSLQDIYDYLGHDKKVIFPMLSRIIKAQETVKALTSNDIDILIDKQLKAIVEVFQDTQIDIGSAPYPDEDYEEDDI